MKSKKRLAIIFMAFTLVLGGAITAYAVDGENTQSETVDGMLHNQGILEVDADPSKDGYEIYANFDNIDKAIKSNAAAIDKVNEQTETVLKKIDGIDIRYNKDSGKPEWRERGADTWTPFKSSGENVKIISAGASGGHSASITMPEDGFVVYTLKSSMNGGSYQAVYKNGENFFSLYVGGNGSTAMSDRYPVNKGDVISISLSGTVNVGGTIIGIYQM